MVLNLTTLFILSTLAFICKMDSEHHEELHCNQDLIKEFVINGLEEPREMNMEVCMSIFSSCCKKPDQMAFFDDFIFSGEQVHIQHRFTVYKRIYFGILDEAREAKKLAEHMIQHIFPKRVMNCRVMASRIHAYNIESIDTALTHAIEDMYKFFHDSYKGLYCSVCDANSHPFFDMESHTITLSNGFCKDLVANSFHFLEYFHKSMLPFVNLLLKFVGSCRSDGEFEEFFIPDDLELKEDESITKMLDRCKNSVNETNWMNYCLPICEKFNLFHFDHFFAPNLFKFSKATDFIHEKRTKMQTEEPKLMLAHANDKSHKYSEFERLKLGFDYTREYNSTEILEENCKEIGNLFFKPFLIKSVGSIKEHVKHFGMEFDEHGLELWNVGKSTNLDLTKFQHLKFAYPDYDRNYARILNVFGILVISFMNLLV